MKRGLLTLALVVICSFLLLSCNVSEENNPTSPDPPDSPDPLPPPDLSSSRYLPLGINNEWNYDYHYAYYRYDQNHQYLRDYLYDTSLKLDVVKQPSNQTGNYWQMDEIYTPPSPPDQITVTPAIRSGILLTCHDGNVYEYPTQSLIIGDEMTVGQETQTSLLLPIGPYIFTSIVPQYTVPAGTFNNVRLLEYNDTWSDYWMSGSAHKTWHYNEYYTENVGLIYAGYYYNYHYSDVGMGFYYDEEVVVQLDSYNVQD